MPQLHPGYVLACQVPPISPARSSTTKDKPVRRSRIAMHNPANPPPMTRTSTSLCGSPGVGPAACDGSLLLDGTADFSIMSYISLSLCRFVLLRDRYHIKRLSRAPP